MRDDDEEDEYSTRKRYKDVNSASIYASSNSKSKETKYISNYQKKKPPPLTDYESPPLLEHNIQKVENKLEPIHEDQNNENQEFNKTGTFKISFDENKEHSNNQNMDDSKDTDDKVEDKNTSLKQESQNIDKNQGPHVLPMIDSPTYSSFPTEIVKTDISRPLNTTNLHEDPISKSKDGIVDQTEGELRILDDFNISDNGTSNQNNKSSAFQEDKNDESYNISQDIDQGQNIASVNETKLESKSSEKKETSKLIKKINIREIIENNFYQNSHSLNLAKNIREIKESNFNNLSIPFTTQGNSEMESNRKHLTSITEFDKEQVSRQFQLEEPTNESRLKDTLGSKRSEVASLTEIFRKHTELNGGGKSNRNELPSESFRKKTNGYLKSKPLTERPHYTLNYPDTKQPTLLTEKEIVTFRTSREPDILENTISRFVHNERKRKEESIREFKLNLEKIVSDVRGTLFNDPFNNSSEEFNKSSSFMTSSNNLIRQIQQTKRLLGEISSPTESKLDELTSRRRAFNLISPGGTTENFNTSGNFKESSPKELSARRLSYIKSPNSDEFNKLFNTSTSSNPETRAFSPLQKENNFNPRKNLMEEFIRNNLQNDNTNNFRSRDLHEYYSFKDQKNSPHRRVHQELILNQRLEYNTPKTLEERQYISEPYLLHEKELLSSKRGSTSHRKYDSQTIEHIRSSIRNMGPIIQEEMDKEETKGKNTYIIGANY